MNTVEKNVSSDQQQPVPQETASQNEALSAPDDTTITSSLQAGINYCRAMAEQMVEEIKNVQEEYDSTRQTNRVLKQNLVDLENEKQRLIADFQNDFRKFDSLNSHVKGLEEEILCLKEFLDPSMKLEEDITLTRIEELKIRSSILQAPLEEQETRLQKIESSVSDHIKDLKEKMNKVEVFNTERDIFYNTGEQLKSLIDHFDAKIRDLTSADDFVKNKEDLEKEIYLLQENCSMEAASVEKKRTDMLVQINMELDGLRSREEIQKNKIRSEFLAKQNILDELKKKTVDKLKQNEELYREIQIEEDAIKNLENESILLHNELHSFENKLPLLEQEKIQIQEVKDCRVQELQTLEKELTFLTEEKENLEENIELLKIKEETMLKNREDVKDKIELKKKSTEIRLLKDISQEENTRLSNEKQQLLVVKENWETETANLIRQITEEKQRYSELQKRALKIEVLQVSDDENESEVMDQLRLIQTEQYSLIELKEEEFDKTTDKFKQVFTDFTDLELSLSQVQQDNEHIEKEIRAKEKSLTTIKQENEFLKSSIQRIKQNVYNGTFITNQELSKRYNLMVNGKNVETERVDKLKQEIANLKARLSSRKEGTREAISESVDSDHGDFLPKDKKSKK